MQKQHRVIFQDEDDVSPVEFAEVVAQDPPTEGRTGAPWEGALSGLHVNQEAEIIHVQEVFHLNGWQADSINIRLHAMQSTAMGCHGTVRQLYPSFQ